MSFPVLKKCSCVHRKDLHIYIHSNTALKNSSNRVREKIVGEIFKLRHFSYFNMISLSIFMCQGRKKIIYKIILFVVEWNLRSFFPFNSELSHWQSPTHFLHIVYIFFLLLLNFDLLHIQVLKMLILRLKCSLYSISSFFTLFKNI